ncbi:unnamed protein product [Rotaria sp. Silwood2]|nr:unnamed protein product [Rotaria sp. Silwood2]CAF2962507.1 unnamed protein product [Rotaria sp. Silwood2]CAF4412601.1 unnamed protein product [Rotaria sp. Silwood2]CAF4577744.1 unnamed protein product [Rotaria sp. Silwood2]CAF4731991.1 unnamed protein product [Rotaria sp. Silwood2]
MDFMRNTIEYSKSFKASRQVYEIRDVPESHYVCQWWIQQFQGIKIENNSNFSIQFKKKHRDQIRWNNAKIPFRRSGLWMTMKVVFHIILTKRLRHIGTVIYKLLIIHFLTYVIGKADSNISTDLLVHCIRKIVRRVNKIEQLLLSINVNDVNEWVQNMKYEIQMKINQILPKSDWQKVIQIKDERNSKLFITNFELNDSNTYKYLCRELNAYLNNQNLSQTLDFFSGSNNYGEFSYVNQDDYIPSTK